MYRLLTLRRLTVLFLALFAVALAGVFVLQRYWVEPAERCEKRGQWWDPEGRACAQPISIAEITGRPNGVSRAEASMQKNRELVDIEHRLAAQRRATNAEIDRERAIQAAR